MTKLNEFEFYQLREQQERAIAARAGSPAIAAIHLEMAESYRRLAEMARREAPTIRLRSVG